MLSLEETKGIQLVLPLLHQHKCCGIQTSLSNTVTGNQCRHKPDHKYVIWLEQIMLKVNKVLINLYNDICCDITGFIKYRLYMLKAKIPIQSTEEWI